MTEEQMTLPGVPVPPQEAWREHTAERWQRDDPESYAECIACIGRGELNKSHLAKRFGRSRNSVSALIMKEFSVEQLKDIVGKRALMVAAEATAQQDELLQDVRVKDLGAVNMTAKMAFDISQLAHGAPTEIKETRHVLTVDDFTDYLSTIPDVTTLPATGSEPGKIPALSATPVALPVEAELLPLGGKSPLPKEAYSVDKQSIAGALVPVFVTLSVVGLEMLTGFLNRGGGG